MPCKQTGLGDPLPSLFIFFSSYIASCEICLAGLDLLWVHYIVNDGIHGSYLLILFLFTSSGEALHKICMVNTDLWMRHSITSETVCVLLSGGDLWVLALPSRFTRAFEEGLHLIKKALAIDKNPEILKVFLQFSASLGKIRGAAMTDTVMNLASPVQLDIIDGLCGLGISNFVALPQVREYIQPSMSC
jgi:hypothetical protein